MNIEYLFNDINYTVSRIYLPSLALTLPDACCREEMPRPSGQRFENKGGAVDVSSPLPPPPKAVHAQLTAAEAKPWWSSQDGDVSR
jgi:hypothetical protein